MNLILCSHDIEGFKIFHNIDFKPSNSGFEKKLIRQIEM